MLSKGFGWRLFLSVVFLAGSVYLVATTQPRLGLDLRGGTQIVYEAQDTESVTVDAAVVQRTVEVLRRRVDAMGTVEPNIQASGDRRIIVELPDVSDPEEAIEVIGQTAQLTFHPVLGIPTGDEEPTEGTVIDDEDGNPIVIGPAQLTGEDVGDAIPLFETTGIASGAWVVQVNFRGEGADKWAELTADAACQSFGSAQRRIAIVLDDQVITSPQVSTSVQCDIGITGGQTVITGNFDEESATDLALLIQAGALPVPIGIVEQGTIGPTLGQAAIAASVDAALIGAGLTLLYMILCYRLLGVTAAISLIAYAVISAGALLMLGTTITLPGIAGFVLAVGMAVDANVLVYERMKEEYEAGATVRDAGFAGFKRAFTAIADSNITTLLAAILLFFFASGSVRGFGVTLTIGVIVSMFTALVFTRVLVDLFTRSDATSSRPGLLGLEVGRGFRDRLAETKPNLVGRTGLLIGIAAAIVALSVAGPFLRGTNFGIEFSGGQLLEYDVPGTVDVEQVREAMAGIGLPRVVVQTSGQGNLLIRTENLSRERQEEVDETIAGIADGAERVRTQFVGPTIGAELRNKALIALGIALAVQLIYLAIRFRWTMGLAAVLAMAHDLAILVGVFAWLGKTFDGVFLAAMLTLIGYSVNDSVVIFDRIREQRKLRPDDPLTEIVNDSCLQTIPRTINTGMGALFILFALWILGGDTLSDFALALIIGTIAGTYSSVFTASPIYLRLEERFPAPVIEPQPEEKPRVYRG